MSRHRLVSISCLLGALLLALTLIFGETGERNTRVLGDVSTRTPPEAARSFDAVGVPSPASWSNLGWPLVGLLVVFAIIAWGTSRSGGQTNATLRLDWFMPVLRRPAVSPVTGHAPWVLWLRSWLPQAWRSDRETKRRGKLRQLLRRLGPSWLATPIRRVVQAVCLLAFLGFFLYVCWPYSARPRQVAEPSQGWRTLAYDQMQGTLQLTNRSQDGEWSPVRDTEFFLQPSEPEQSELPVVRVVVQELALDDQDIQIVLAPATEEAILQLFDLQQQFDQFVLWQEAPDTWPSHYADNLHRKEWLAAEFFLIIDPLVSLSTAIASRSWVWSLVAAACILAVCILIPRGFCGYLCPLGTTIDLFDWCIANRLRRWQIPDNGWWVHLKYYLLIGILVSSACGVLVSGYFAAIPVVTRGALFLVDPLQLGTLRGWHLVPAWNWGHFLSVGLFACVLGLGFLRPRFWCKYVCPSGAVFSLGNLLRVTERKVESSCIHCNKCVEICPFDAIKPDFTTRTTDCTLCQSCGGVCPTHAIKFVERNNVVELKLADDPPTNETALGRRGFLAWGAGTTAAAIGGVGMAGLTSASSGPASSQRSLVRPPGSVPEEEFLQMCIRCGECFKACPNSVLQPEAFEQGLAGLWTPQVIADWAGCESSCNACGQVCPTGAIRALPLAEKRVARMGLAIVNEATCLPFAGVEDCDLCVQECNAAGYHAIEYMQVGTEVSDDGQPIEGTGYLAPVVRDELCVGCGLCQTRCYSINKKERSLLAESAIVIEAGEGKEDRIMQGSYIALRTEREKQRAADSTGADSDFFIPDSANSEAVESPGSLKQEGKAQQGSEQTDGPPVGADDENPFGF